ncbi:thioredoxin [Paraconexibacter algicola]|uniref:Thioredoxin n=1 Tax=Paraconexibacter algicola TaxID=2133960 RepID=A0A2T4UH35_9ACTN|nr:thioredoxin family protein [Paraconexibacter algicola]PTL58519.1 thioredoxin [Paraconexibacter algicola]
MNRTAYLAASICVLIAAAGVFLAVGGSDDPDGRSAPALSRTPPTVSVPPYGASRATPDAAVAERSGTYVEYSPAALAAADGTRLLFFHASWCTQCRALEQSIRDEGLPAGVTVLKVDYDERQDLRQRYGVTLQTTVVRVDAEGRKTGSVVPYDDPQITKVLDELA